ncbi:MAG: hypothetical protein SWY16_05940 [Cyanobacteriota bacterium]|nr:hypothetical protein [Cyanobacteriota bacterium]
MNKLLVAGLEMGVALGLATLGFSDRQTIAIDSNSVLGDRASQSREVRSRRP